MIRLFSIFFVAALVAGQSSDGCTRTDLKPIQFGDCSDVSNYRKVIYSKTCIFEFDQRNYTIGWQGAEKVACVRVNTNGNVHLVQGGIGDQLAVVFIESSKGVELDWESDIFVQGD
ncbi:hypothetical protein GWI33_018700 [Rhynchophorus ferrugineus]|uniref:Secreted protein n=1 Tax=Rhynchophorus ferrugineus TaxID=354439 RepID=A0A834I6U0_RHYFE|nr:hypothetical protein GWI33_018700 [Rhynchophorus ferrugineus]